MVQDYSYVLCDAKLILLYIPKGHVFMIMIVLVFKGEREEKYQDCTELSYCTTMIWYFFFRKKD